MSKVICFDATTIGDAWFQAVHKTMTEGRRYLITQGSYAGIHRAGISVVINILHPGVRPLAPIMPEGSNLPPPTTEADIEEYLNYLMTGVRQLNEHYTYGEDLHWQIPWAVKHYKEGGFGNNHCYMTVGRPETVHFYDRDVDYNEAIVV
ncbi:MAG: thymidylate synthase, partial [Patescibacteria group bacterium]